MDPNYSTVQPVEVTSLQRFQLRRLYTRRSFPQTSGRQPGRGGKVTLEMPTFDCRSPIDNRRRSWPYIRKVAIEDWQSSNVRFRFAPVPSSRRTSTNCAQVIGVVVGHQQGLAQNGLAVAPGDAGVQIGLWVRHQVLHGLQIFAELLNTFVPCGRTRRSFRLRPIAFGPLGRRVLRSCG